MGETGQFWPCVNYPAASKLAGTQVHSHQALIRVSFIETSVFIEQGFSSRRLGLLLGQIAIFTQGQEIGSEVSVSN